MDLLFRIMHDFIQYIVKVDDFGYKYNKFNITALT